MKNEENLRRFICTIKMMTAAAMNNSPQPNMSTKLDHFQKISAPIMASRIR
jgi:hypothetical protein